MNLIEQLRKEQARLQRIIDNDVTARRKRTLGQRLRMAQRSADEIERLTAVANAARDIFPYLGIAFEDHEPDHDTVIAITDLAQALAALKGDKQ